MIIPIAVIVICLLLYYYGTRNFKYWQKRGIIHDKPIPFFGNNIDGYLFRKSVTQIATDMYRKYPNEKVVGFYRANIPELVVRDPETIKRVLVTDFEHLYPRGINHKEVVEPLMRNLFFADGDLWRLLRQRMTPAFTSGKLKAMFPLIIDCADRLQKRALTVSAAGKKLDARDLMARYTTDFIGACGFGVNADSLGDEDSAFRKLGAQIFQPRVQDLIVAILKEVFPDTFKHLKYLSRLEDDFKKFVSDVLHLRNYKPSGRNDFIDLMLECKQKGTIVGESIERRDKEGRPEKATVELDDTLIAAQVFVFFAAGFETSSSATSYTLHELAFNPEIQERVQKEIDTVLAKHDNKLSYDAVKEMTYLEWTFKEAMRMLPSLGFLIRQSVRPYTFPELGLSIDADVGIMIPLQALHTDPEYFDNPMEFRPERFDPENFTRKQRDIYLPFGTGPRACIGERLGLMQSLAGLAAVLSKFSVSPAADTKRWPEIDPRSDIVQTIVGGLPLQFNERKRNVVNFN
ncbi:cytochrome P450 6B6-like [Amyelois transitella]|uniref:cytochrome P450 6B6-like n=1 Tax=Amyelois transitella TaxID=680683 RepID=UPI00067B47E2|nr:cytochrome P450 6B6-like [Amyelois transitella]